MTDPERGMSPEERLNLLIKHETNEEKKKHLQKLLAQIQGMSADLRSTFVPKSTSV